jgi:K+ transporter
VTSAPLPFYALDQIFFGHGGVPRVPDNVLGCISLVIWTLTIIVAIKYAILVSRPAYYYYGLGDEVQLSAEVVPVKVQ